MNRSFTAGALASAVGLAVAMQSGATFAMGYQGNPAVIKQTEDRMAAEHLEKCYGINAVGKNDCSTGRAHACAGLSTVVHDPDSFVLVPMGACLKIEGGATALREGKG